MLRATKAGSLPRKTFIVLAIQAAIHGYLVAYFGLTQTKICHEKAHMANACELHLLLLKCAQRVAEQHVKKFHPTALYLILTALPFRHLLFTSAIKPPFVTRGPSVIGGGTM